MDKKLFFGKLLNFLSLGKKKRETVEKSTTARTVSSGSPNKNKNLFSYNPVSFKCNII